MSSAARIDRGTAPGAGTIRLPLGARAGLAGLVYGSIIVMATITAAAGTNESPRRIAILVCSTVIVVWVGHVYAHGIGASIERGRRLDFDGLRALALRESGIPLAAVLPIAMLVLGAAGVLREERAIWLAILIGLAELFVQGVRYARIERLTGVRRLLIVALNLGVGLGIVLLKILVAH